MIKNDAEKDELHEKEDTIIENNNNVRENDENK